MATSAIRFKNAGTGSADPAEKTAYELGRVFDIVNCHKTQKFFENSSPWKAVDQGLPCFRPGGDSGLQILDPEKESWYDFLTWWTARYPDQMDAYNYAVTKATEALNSLPTADPATAQMYHFCVCLPRLAGNIVLHRKDAPFLLHNPPRLHVYPWWYAESWQQPLKVTARWDNLNCSLNPSNRLAVFWERLSTLASQWDGSEQIPDFASAYYAVIEGNISENGHPWPVGENVSGLVPITGAMSRAVLPIGMNGNDLIFAVDNWMLADDLGGEGMDLFDCKPDANYVPTEMFAVWENINPAHASFSTAERTPVNVLPTPDETSGPYLCGRYCDPETREIIIVKCNQYHWIGGTSFEDGTEHKEVDFGGGLVGATIGSIPFGFDYAHGGVAWNFMVPAITPDYASRRLRLARTMFEEVMPAYKDGPIVEIEVNTGTGGNFSANDNTAVVQFYCDGYPYIYPVGNTPEADEIKTENGIVTIKIVYSQYFEVDGMGRYYGYQRKKFRYVISCTNYTRTEWTLYPKTLSAEGLIIGPPEDPGEYIGY